MRDEFNSDDFGARAPAYKTRVEQFMSDFVDANMPAPGKLKDAIEYAVASEGKRIRPLLAYATAEMFGLSADIADYPAAAVELVHTYSLIHDDLPAMDDDDLRRGKPTVHKQFDEATAILVGDALQGFAFELLAAADVNPAVIVGWTRALAIAGGAQGMIWGQSMDLEGETRQLDLTELKSMHHSKSGALITASMTLVALAAPDAERTRKQLTVFGQHIGLAFQIRDDILDVEASTEQLGKPQGSDELSNKSTFVSLLGIEAARQKMADSLKDAEQALDSLGDRAQALRWLANYVTDRKF